MLAQGQHKPPDMAVERRLDGQLQGMVGLVERVAAGLQTLTVVWQEGLLATPQVSSGTEVSFMLQCLWHPHSLEASKTLVFFSMVMITYS